MIRRAATLAAAIAAGCSSPTRTAIAPPPNVDLVALLELDARGQVYRGSGLFPWDPARGTTFFGNDRAAILVGYARATLMAQGAPADGATLAADRLSPAIACAPRLADPAFAAEIGSGGALKMLDPTSVSPLTAAWLSAGCDDVPASSISFSLDCERFRCPQTITKLGACRYAVTLDCGFGAFDATLRPDGSLCFLPSNGSATTCDMKPPDAPAAGADRCMGPKDCTLEAYRAPASPFFDEAEARLTDAPPYSPAVGLTGMTPQLFKQARYVGYVYDAAITDSAIIVSNGPGTPVERCTTASTAGTLDFYDLETLAKRSSTPAPGCLLAVAPDPMRAVSGAEIVGVFLRGGAFTLGRFDAHGMPMAATFERADQPAELDPLCDRPTALTVLGTPPRLIAVFERDGGSDACGMAMSSVVYTYDLATLRPRSRTALLGQNVYSTSPADDHTLILGDTVTLQLEWFDVDAESVANAVVLPQDVARNDNVAADVAFLPAQNRALLAIARNSPALYLVDPHAGILTRAVIFEADVQPIAARPWPSDPRLALVAATNAVTATDWPLYVALFDVERARYLPGARRLGHGPVSRVSLDARGRVWLLLPWEGKLVRLTPR